MTSLVHVPSLRGVTENPVAMVVLRMRPALSFLFDVLADEERW